MRRRSGQARLLVTNRTGITRASAIGIALVMAFAFACGSARLPAPRYAPHPTSALKPVPYPPPPARVEDVPPRPSEEVVWIDGEWRWQGRGWVWRRGRWVKPPPDVRFSPWTSVRDQRGGLFVAQGTWRNARGDEVAEPAQVGGDQELDEELPPAAVPPDAAPPEDLDAGVSM